MKTRRQFLQWTGRCAAGCALGGIGLRVLAGKGKDAEFVQPPHRYGWQIKPEACKFCGLCETACVRKPSAVKAVNDQTKCSNCVACYGHLLDKNTPDEKIAIADQVVCPRRAVSRKPFSDDPTGAYIYTIDPALCTGCARCALACNEHGNKSLFVLIRPDLCLGCNECAIARVCPHNAVERVPIYPVNDFRGLYLPGGGTVVEDAAGS